jgi:dienelactone hydrolase
VTASSQPLIPGDRILGYLTKPEGAGPFPAVIGLCGCVGMHHATKRRLVDELVGWSYVTLLVDSFATRGIDHACTSGKCFATLSRTPDAYGALVFLARQNLRRSTTCGRSRLLTRRFGLPLGGGDQFVELFALPSNLRFRAAVAFYPLFWAAGARPGIPTLILIVALDVWTPAADCSNKIATWGNDGPPIEVIV